VQFRPVGGALSPTTPGLYAGIVGIILTVP
jgi:hypothetical protein